METPSCSPEDNAYKNMQESPELHLTRHLDEVVAAVSVTPQRKAQDRLLQTHDKLFRPPREKLQHCAEKAKLYLDSHEHKHAIRELVRCVALTRICYGDAHWKLAEAHVNLAQGYLQLGGLSLQAKQHAEKAKDILTSSVTASCADSTDMFKCSIELFLTTAQVLLALQKAKEAAESLSKAERLSHKLLQCGCIPEDEWVDTQWRIELTSAQIYQGQKKPKEALARYQKALNHAVASKGEKSLECVPILRELAGAEQALGLHDAAMQHFRQAHLTLLSRGPSDEDAADSAHCVAHAAITSGTPEHRDVAGQYFQETLEHLKKCEEPGKAKFLSVQDEYCQFLQATGQQERAFAILRESLEAKESVFGDLSPEVTETYRILSTADLAQKNYTGAHKKLKKCLQLQTLLYGAQDRRTQATREALDRLSRLPEMAVKRRQPLKTKPTAPAAVSSRRPPGRARPSTAH
ncbi:tetratricopeptide repeat protein 23 [Sorex araneus]|uniref:tetratricopeptide repeat protein 23 n=1 Tax=Sorex araneus TaxID=42254 RepID=UPI0024336B98|nr:tetratricopeptide repeat protein 23 [Sorex araneus]